MHQILPALIDCKPSAFPFAIDVAALASRRDYLNLEKWVRGACCL